MEVSEDKPMLNIIAGQFFMSPGLPPMILGSNFQNSGKITKEMFKACITSLLCCKKMDHSQMKKRTPPDMASQSH